MQKIRLLVAEDEVITRLGLIKLLESCPNYFVVGEAENGYDLIEKHAKVRPDIVLCDISLPLMNGFEASRRILNQDSSAKIILNTVHKHEDFLCKAIRIGVHGFITKSQLYGDWKYAIQTVSEGGTYYQKKTEEEIKKIRSRRCNWEVCDKSDILTKREKEILKLVAQGMTSIMIADTLGTSKRTIDHFRSQIINKLNLESASKLVKYAVQSTGSNEREDIIPCACLNE